MSCGAAFVRVGEGREGEDALRLVHEAIQSRNLAWLAASPEHGTDDHTLRLHGGSPWLSIADWAPREVLQDVSARLQTETISVSAMDEFVSSFEYTHLVGGRILPWQPLQRTFSPAVETRFVAADAERKDRRLRKLRGRPWWKVW